VRDILGELKDKVESVLTGKGPAKPPVPAAKPRPAAPATRTVSKASPIASNAASQAKPPQPPASSAQPNPDFDPDAASKPAAGSATPPSAEKAGEHPSDVKVEDERSLAVSGALEFSGEVLTSEGGKLRIPDESRNLCALFDNGMWLVSASHRLSPLVTSVAQMARRHGYKINEPRYVTPNIIRSAYLYADRQTTVARLDDNAVRRRIVDTLQKAVEAGANDVHIEASDGRTRIEFRIDGALRLWETWTQKEGELMLSSVYSHSVGQSGATANWQEPQAAMLTSTATGPDALVLPKGVISVRCQWVPLSDGGRYLDMRLQYDSAYLFGENFIMADVDSLGFSQEQLRVVKSLRQAPGGMRVFAGPVNQGKTTTLANLGSNYLCSGKVPGRMGNAHQNIVPYQTFEASDVHLILAVGNDRQFTKFCEIAGRPAWAIDPRFATNAEREIGRASCRERV